MHKQQKEVRAYFEAHAQAWRIEAAERSLEKDNSVAHRNDYVLRVIGERRATTAALDVGCGTGDLVFGMAKRNIETIGVDFAPEMIQIAQSRVKRGQRIRLVTSSIFDFDMGKNCLDVIAANGFIEYISLREMRIFFKRSAAALTKGGSLVISSRNRLFNLFSANRFAEQEIQSKVVAALLAESVAIVSKSSIASLMKLQPASLSNTQQEQQKTGIDVSVRYQYTPVQLMQLLSRYGLKTEAISPIHVHAVTPAFKEKHPAVHFRIANTLYPYTYNERTLIPNASTFMIHAKKK